MYQNANNRRRESRRGPSRQHADPYYVTHDFGGTATLSETVLHAVSGVANVDVRKVEQAIAGQIDPAALDRLFQPGQPATRSFGQLSLALLGHDVTIYTNGQIVITPQTGR